MSEHEADIQTLADLLTCAMLAGVGNDDITRIVHEEIEFQCSGGEQRSEFREKERKRRAARRAECSDRTWMELRVAVFKRDGFACVYCGVEHHEPHCDHIIPVARGGRSDLSNLATACPRCNASKGALTLSEWLRVGHA
jgi:5-methylcytosine-specific restriction endonuclease McrA